MGAMLTSLAGRVETPDKFIHRVINEHCVVVFSKTHCPYSQMAKDIFTMLEVPIKAIDIDLRSDGDSIQDTLKSMTRVRTVRSLVVGRHNTGRRVPLMPGHGGGEILYS